MGAYTPEAHIEELHDGRYVCWITFPNVGQTFQHENVISPSDDCRSTLACFSAVADVICDSGHDSVTITRHRKES